MPMNLFDAALGAAAVLAVPFAAIGLTNNGGGDAASPLPAAATVAIAAATIDYPLPGEFLRGGQPAAAPVERLAVPAFRIMRHQVGLADYLACVADGACARPDAAAMTADVPATGVNWRDAQAYAAWYSKRTGGTWRLPTAAETAVAAGERFGGEALSAAADDPANPAVRWLRRYREEAAAKRPADPDPKPRGHYGPNSRGIEDFGGNVWEWTSTCYRRVHLDADGAELSATDNCGVHVLEGRHRAYMSNFVRDGKSGGCAVGTPPENLGFRLVQEQPAGLIATLRSLFGARPDRRA